MAAARRFLRVAGLSGAHSARRRSRASIPVHLEPFALARGPDLRPRDRRVEAFARVKVPKSLPRWIPFGRRHQFVPLEQVIGANLGSALSGNGDPRLQHLPRHPILGPRARALRRGRRPARRSSRSRSSSDASPRWCASRSRTGRRRSCASFCSTSCRKISRRTCRR